MTRAFLTGATGFVGSHVARALLARGVAVTCLARRESRREAIEGLPLSIVPGDLRDPEAVRAAVRGHDVVFHCAADYRLFVPDPRAMHATNVEGTRNVLRAAADAGVRRVIYTSTVGVLGRRRDGAPADEETPVRLSQMIGPYKRTKFLAERVADEWVARGLPVVIVNPSTPVGEGDGKPTATGQMIVDFLRGRIPAYVDTGLNLVDVRDVAVGHVLAAEKGRVGERYILGNENLSLRDILGLLAGISGRPAPRIRLPHWVPLTVSALETWASALVRREPRVPLDAVRLARHPMYFDAGKAVRELGLPQTPVREALERSVAWFRDQGHVERRKAG